MSSTGVKPDLSPLRVSSYTNSVCPRAICTRVGYVSKMRSYAGHFAAAAAIIPGHAMRYRLASTAWVPSLDRMVVSVGCPVRLMVWPSWVAVVVSRIARW